MTNLQSAVITEWEADGKRHVARRLLNDILIEVDGWPRYQINKARLHEFEVPFSKPCLPVDLDNLRPILRHVADKNEGAIIAAARGLWQALYVADEIEAAELTDPELQNVLINVDGLTAHFLPTLSPRQRAMSIWQGDATLLRRFPDATEEEKLVMLRKHCRGAESWQESDWTPRLRDAAIAFDPANTGRVPSPTDKERKRSERVLESKPGHSMDARTDAWLRKRFDNKMPAYTTEAESWMKPIIEWYGCNLEK